MNCWPTGWCVDSAETHDLEFRRAARLNLLGDVLWLPSHIEGATQHEPEHR